MSRRSTSNCSAAEAVIVFHFLRHSDFGLHSSLGISSFARGIYNFGTGRRGLGFANLTGCSSRRGRGLLLLLPRLRCCGARFVNDSCHCHEVGVCSSRWASSAHGVPGCSWVTRVRCFRALSPRLLNLLPMETSLEGFKIQVLFFSFLNFIPRLAIASMPLYVSVRTLAAKARPYARS